MKINNEYILNRYDSIVLSKESEEKSTYTATDKKSREEVQIIVQKFTDSVEARIVLRQIIIQKQLKHESILQLLDVVHSDEQVHLVYESFDSPLK